MATRRDAREWALQILFGMEFNRDTDPVPVVEGFMQDKACTPPVRAFMQALVDGVLTHREAIDAVISTAAQHWDIRRMGGVERNVLRIGVFELLYCEEVPPASAINEAVDIAKYFSSRESGRFINGILDQVRKTEAPRSAASAAADGDADGTP